MKEVLFVILFLLSFGEVGAVNLLPQANLKLSASRIELGQELTLDATDSLNSQGVKYGLSYRFKANKNASWTTFSYYPVFKYTPISLGMETAYLEVSDIEKNYKKIVLRDYRVIMPIERNVKIKILNSGSKNAGEEIFFQLDFIVPHNTDMQNIKSRWDFDGDGVFDTKFENIQTVSYVFQNPGTFTPKAEVIFPTGEKIFVKGLEPLIAYYNRNRLTQNEFKKLKINPVVIQSPIVNIFPSYKVYKENTSITFDMTKTVITPNSWIEIQFDGESTKLIREKKITKRFKSAGTHNVIVRHCYNRAKPVCSNSTTKIYVKKDPTNFSTNISIYDLNEYNVSQNTGSYQKYNQFKLGKRLKFQVNLNTLSSTARKFEFRWDFDGDGNFDTPFSTKNYAEYTFARGGNYKTCVQVKNEFTREDKALVSDYKILKIVNNEKPVGYFQIQKLQNSVYEKNNLKVFVGDRVRIVPVLSDLDNHRSQLSVRFDINNDGIWETNFDYNYGFNWQFSQAGKYRGKMQIKDKNGMIQTIIQSFTIYENPKPIINVQVSKKRGKIGEVFVISARKSQGNNLRYSWGIPENNDIINSRIDQISITFQTKGKKVLSLVVTDILGQKKWVQFPIFIE